jgi:hypothetical protein
MQTRSSPLGAVQALLRIMNGTAPAGKRVHRLRPRQETRRWHAARKNLPRAAGSTKKLFCPLVRIADPLRSWPAVGRNAVHPTRSVFEANNIAYPNALRKLKASTLAMRPAASSDARLLRSIDVSAFGSSRRMGCFALSRAKSGCGGRALCSGEPRVHLADDRKCD